MFFCWVLYVYSKWHVFANVLPLSRYQNYKEMFGLKISWKILMGSSIIVIFRISFRIEFLGYADPVRLCNQCFALLDETFVEVEFSDFDERNVDEGSHTSWQVWNLRETVDQVKANVHKQSEPKKFCKQYVFYLDMCPVVHRRSEMIFPTNITDISKVKVVLQWKFRLPFFK